LKRRLPREYAFKILFMIDVGKNESESALCYLLDNIGFSAQEESFCTSLVEGVLKKREELDKTLSLYLINWQFDRLAAVIRNILRLALYEMLYLDDIPPAVAINEAIELAKAYQDEEAARFVNGILDSIRKNSRGQETNPSRP
jgi:N utilization substance protein B